MDEDTPAPTAEHQDDARHGPEAIGAVTCGVDVGGTFTDVVLFGHGRLAVLKVPTTYPDPSTGVLVGVRRILDREQVAPAEVSSVIHGSTVGINAIIQRRGARVALVTTEGFRDVLQIGRQTRPALYDLSLDRLPPLVPRRHRFEVLERVMYDGAVRTPLRPESVDRVIGELRSARVEALAVCLLHSYAQPDHEQQLARALREAFPDTFVCLSSELLKEFREYERMSTTVINAYIGPLTAGYIRNLETSLRDLGCPNLSVMQADGGLMSPELASRQPVRTIESGPAGGVIGAATVGARAGREKVIALDMGGTTTKVSLIMAGTPALTSDYEVCQQLAGDRLVAGSGYPVRTPVIDLVEVGAGGGSVAWIDSGGGLRVGPRSAGSTPGPACYGRGGTEPTVTDANVVLGRIDPSGFLDSDMRLDAGRAREAVSTIASALDITIEEAAEGIVRVANATMVRGVRLVTVERGHDVREFTLIATGGAAPAHVGQIAEALGIRDSIVPPSPGVFSAIGFLWAEPRSNQVRTWLRATARIRPDELTTVLDSLAEEVAGELAAGLDDPEVTVGRTADLRYQGQSYELQVDLPGGPISPEDLATVEQRFHDLHRATYGFASPSEATEFVNVRVSVTTQRARPESRSEPLGDPDPGAARTAHRPVYFGTGFVQCPVYDRARLRAGNVITGPAIIQEPGSTHVLFPARTAYIDQLRNINDQGGAPR
ncbi:hydantoinase/oxoprolinase family protein [Solwaraspora sp. WMMB335]|uniref:hydantoinase/oxoprolinase family protein n=1 Tax=Solwaraspora sp. WMMB335 TaxID=3404118 RepID=UPI003B95F1C2